MTIRDGARPGLDDLVTLKANPMPEWVQPRTATYRLDGGSYPLEAVMAIDPMSFDQVFSTLAGHEGGLQSRLSAERDSESKPYRMVRSTAQIDIMGPLARRGYEGWFWSIDGYDFIESRFAAALADPTVESVVLHIDSPGGAASGVFETAARMRAMAKASGKKVVAYADDMAASAAYALATAADEIYLPESGIVGSIGVLGVLAEQSVMLQKLGINVRVVTTGQQKADGHPAVALTEDVVKRYQARVDHLGDLFFALVAEARNMTPRDVKRLEAGVFQGAAAKAAGLADGVMSFAEVLDTMTSASNAGQTSGKERVEMTIDATAATSGSAKLMAIALACGLAASATESEIIDQATSLRGLRESLFAATGKGTGAEALGVVQAGMIATKAVPGLQQELQDLKKAEATRRVDACVVQAKHDGKITNAATERELRALGATHPEQLEALVAALPVLVTTAATATREVAPSDDAVWTEADAQVAKQLGLTRQQMLESKKLLAEEQAAAKGGV
jgi:signal peptide peptidase SppA